MQYALVVENQIVGFGLPTSARRLDTRQWVLGLPDASDAMKAACGYLPVVEVEAPVVAADKIAERSVQLVSGAPTEVWTVRDKTPDELSPAPTADERLAAARAALEALDTLNAPILTADVVDVLAELREVL